MWVFIILLFSHLSNILIRNAFSDGVAMWPKMTPKTISLVSITVHQIQFLATKKPLGKIPLNIKSTYVFIVQLSPLTFISCKLLQISHFWKYLGMTDKGHYEDKSKAWSRGAWLVSKFFPGLLVRLNTGNFKYSIFF